MVVTTDIGSTVQAYDADLTSIAALTGTSGLLTTNGSGTWSVDTNTYSTTAHNHTLDNLSNVVITSATDGQALVWDTTTSKWVNETISAGDALPNQTSNDWKFLQTNGASASWSNTLEALYFEFQGVGMDRDVYGYAGLTKSPAGISFNSYHYTGGIAGGNLNIYAEGTLGLSSLEGITIWSNDLNSTGPETGALVVYGGVGISKDVWIDGNLYVNGTTITENAKTVATHDNLIYLNAALDSTITNAVFASGSITYTAENIYTAGMDIRITGVDPVGFNIATGDNLTVAAATPTQFIVVKSDPGASYVSGGTAHAKEEINPDLGFAGGYYDSGYAHAGLFRDASDGTFKFFDGYTPEPDESVNIDTGHASFSLADISASNAYFSGSVSGNWNGSVIPTTKGGTGLTTLGTAGQVLAVNASANAIQWITPSAGGGSSAAAVTSDPPASPELNQVWQDLDTGRIYVWNGTFWIEVQQNGSLGLLRYLGAASSAPVTSIDGSALQTGEVYFDTVFNGMKVYDGTAWEDAFSAASLSVGRWVKTAVGGETSLSGNDDSSLTLVYTPGIEEVYLNGVKLIRGSDYIGTSGSVISNLEPLIANSVVEVISYSGFTVANTYTKTEVDNLIQKKGVRWIEVVGVGASVTTLTGLDDYSNTLSYTPGTEQVFIYGILVTRGLDYTATDGSSVVLVTPVLAGDVVEISGTSTFSVANTYTKAEVDTKLNVLTSPTINGNTSAAGNISPSVTNTYDLGTTSLRWRNIYTQDLHLSNGIGDYTVVEGEEDLFLVNNKSGKSFKFALIEVDPSQVPPKSESN